MAKIEGDYRLVAGILTNASTAGESTWAVILETRAEKVKATEELGLTVLTVQGTGEWYVYTGSLREAETFKEQWFPDQ